MLFKKQKTAYISTRNDGELFDLARLRSKTKTLTVLIRKMLFEDDASLVAPNEQALQSLVDRFSQACNDFELKISLKKTQIMSRDNLALFPIFALETTCLKLLKTLCTQPQILTTIWPWEMRSTQE